MNNREAASVYHEDEFTHNNNIIRVANFRKGK